jgi:hypothetical protein
LESINESLEAKCHQLESSAKLETNVEAQEKHLLTHSIMATEEELLTVQQRVSDTLALYSYDTNCFVLIQIYLLNRVKSWPKKTRN